MVTPTARMGDYCTHGAVIITGSTNRTVDGRAIIRLGDMVSCPIKGHGVNPIIAVTNNVYSDSKATVRMGAIALCGAVVFVGSSDVLTP